MLYAKLRICKIYKEELENLKKLKRTAQAADILTTTGERKRSKVPEIETEIQAVTALYDDAIKTVLADDKFKKMDNNLKAACKLYYFKNQKLEIVEATSYVSNLIRTIRNYCRNF